MDITTFYIGNWTPQTHLSFWVQLTSYAYPIFSIDSARGVASWSHSTCKDFILWNLQIFIQTKLGYGSIYIYLVFPLYILYLFVYHIRCYQELIFYVLSILIWLSDNILITMILSYFVIKKCIFCICKFGIRILNIW